MASGQYEIEHVDDKTARRAFLQLPHRLYRNDPAWVPPLDLLASEALDTRQPVHQHMQARFFLARRNGQVVGRISAQLDELFEATHGRRSGFFGLLEAEDDPELIAALITAASDWLRSLGAAELLGPFNLNINQEVGLLVNGFETPPYFLMGHGQPYYGPYLERAGLEPAQDMLAYLVGTDFEAPRAMQRMLRGSSQVIALRSLRRSAVADDLEILRDIFNDAWRDNWGFVPFTYDEFQATGRELVRLLPPDFIQIAEIDGKPEGFIVLVPNLNEAIADMGGRLLPLNWISLVWRLFVRYPNTARVPLMGVRHHHHQTRLGAAIALTLIHKARDAARRKGVAEVEMSWILEDNQGMRSMIEAIGGEVSKRYRVYRMTL